MVIKVVFSVIVLFGLFRVNAAPPPQSLLSNAYSYYRIYSRKVFMLDDTSNSTISDQTQCPYAFPNNTFAAINHFQSIFFGDFAVYTPGQEIEGPLAVGGDFIGSNYTINSNADQFNCSVTTNSSDPFANYGLVVNGSVSATDIKVNGDALLANGARGVTVLQPTSCNVSLTNGTGDLDFTSLQYAASNMSFFMANGNPTMILDSDGNLRYISNDTNATSNNPYNSIKFDSCTQPGSCGVPSQFASNPQGILFGNGTWNGTQGETVPTNRPFIFNIPVTSGTTLTINTTNPSQGFFGCNTIYHIYPVDNQGNIQSNGSFTLNRETQEYLYGLLFAPRGTIIDGPQGGFQGQVIANGYSWVTNVTASIKAFDNVACMTNRTCFPFDNIGNATTGANITTTSPAASTTTLEVSSTTVIGSTTVVAGTSTTESSSTEIASSTAESSTETISPTESATETTTSTESSATETTVIGTTATGSTTVVSGTETSIESTATETTLRGSTTSAATETTITGTTAIEGTTVVPGTTESATTTEASVTETSATGESTAVTITGTTSIGGTPVTPVPSGTETTPISSETNSINRTTTTVTTASKTISSGTVTTTIASTSGPIVSTTTTKKSTTTTKKTTTHTTSGTKTTTKTKTKTSTSAKPTKTKKCKPGHYGLGNGDGKKGACCKDQSDCIDDCRKGACVQPVD